MSKTLNKIVSTFVSLTTIVWSVGVGTLALPGVASAATLASGDLIKASGPAVYYYAGDQKRYVFPNETTFKSWFVDFSSVKTITDAELAAISIGGNVTIRPGTRLVKITTDPKVYAVTPGGVLNWVASESVATALWGSNWARNVVDVSDAFFVNYNSTAGATISTNVHPEGSLVSYAGDSNKYVIVGGQKRKFASDAAFAANGYNAANVIQTTIQYPSGSDVTANEPALSSAVTTVGGGTVQAGAMTVTLASDTPAGVTVPRNAASVAVAKFNLAAAGGDVTVAGLRIHRVGVGATTDLANVYLYDADGNRLTTGLSVNSTNNNVEFNNLNLKVSAGQTKTIVVQADFGAASAGGQHLFELEAASAVTLTGSGVAGGSFPLRGNTFTVGNTLAGRLDVQKGTTPTNPNIGSSEVEISNFKLIANTNDIEVRRLTLIQAGTVTNSDLSNLKLYQGTTLLASAATMSNDKMVFNFTTPFVITNGTTKTFSVRSAVAGRAGRTIRTYAEYTTDVYAVDKLYNSGAAVCISSTAQGGCTAAAQGSFNGSGANFIEVTTQGGLLTVAFNGPSTSNIARGSQDVPLFKFSLTSSDNALEIRNLDFTLAGGGMVKGTAGTEYFRDIKVKDLDTGLTLMGPTSLASTVASGAISSGLITLSQPFTVASGKTMNLAITADLGNTEDVANQFYGSGTSTYAVTLGDATPNIFASGDVRVVSTGENLDVTTKVVPNGSIVGNTLTVKSSSLTVGLASGIASATVVKKQSNIPAVGFTMTAGGQSDVLVTAVKLTGRGNIGAGLVVTDLADVVTSCSLYDGNTRLGNPQSPDAVAGTMNFTNISLSIPKSTTKSIVAYCTADSVVAQAGGDTFNLGIATPASDITAQDGDSNSVTAGPAASGITVNAGATPTVSMTVRSAGTLTVTTDNLRQSTILVAGGDVWQNLAQFRATAQYEDVNIDRVAVTSTGHSANFALVAVAKDGAVKGSDVLPSGFSTPKDVDLSSNVMTVTKDGSITFQLWGKVSPIVASSSVSGASTVARSGNTVQLGLASNITSGEWNSSYNDKYNVHAIGAASGDLIYATSSNMTGGTLGNAFVLRKSKPIVSRQALTTATLSSGIDMDLFKFQVAADSAGSVALKKLTFNFSKATTTNSSLSLSQFRLRRGSTDITSNVRIVSQNGDDLYNSSWIMASSSGQIVVEFTNGTEETVSGSGNVYTLHGVLSGTINTGDSISLSFRRTSSSTYGVGYLTGDFVTSTTPGPHVNTTAAPSDAADLEGTLVWSDMSEIPHSAYAGSSNGSRDWANDLFVDDLTATQVLSR